MEKTAIYSQKNYLRMTLLVAIVATLCMSLYTVLANAANEQSLLTASTIEVDKAVAQSAELLTYRVTLFNPSKDVAVNANLISSLPDQLRLIPDSTTMTARSNGANLTDRPNSVSWSGTIAPRESVVVTYKAAIHATRAQIGDIITHEAYVIVGDVGSIISAETEIVATSPTATRAISRDLTGSKKSVNADVAQPGDTLTYTIVLSNSGASQVDTFMTDALPADVEYVTSSLTATGGQTTTFTYNADTNEVSWRGFLSPSASATVTFQVDIQSTGVISGDIITNTASIVDIGTNESSDVVATTTVNVPVNDFLGQFLPTVFRELLAPTLSLGSKPNSANSRTLSWTSRGAGVTYELQIDDHPEFSTPEPLVSQTTTTYTHAPAVSHNNVLYYRVRTVAPTTQRSAWSNVVAVAGSYFDDFNSDATGWAIRRTTLLEEVFAYYETPQSWYVIQVHDKWDWGIASPMRPAPEPPYVLEMRMQPVNNGNLISFGIVTRGNWDGEPCIDYSSLPGIYERMNCFSEFYNSNLINVGGYGERLKLLWEKIDYLQWCPGCGNSPMKRLSNNVDTWVEVSSVPNIKQGQNQWNDWRIEVYADRQIISVNGQQFATYANSDHNQNPYFGIFASTDEYNNSTWRIDFVRVTPLD